MEDTAKQDKWDEFVKGMQNLTPEEIKERMFLPPPEMKLFGGDTKQGNDSAFISKCEKYRYSLTRTWDENKPKVMFVMLNPSTADGTQDDPTIRRCIGFAKFWGYGGMHVCNLFAYRATDPKELLKVDNPFGDQNIWVTRKLADEVETIVCAWGNRPILNKLTNSQSPFMLLHYCVDKLHFIELSKDETPKHPLYLKSNLKPVKMYDAS